MATAYAQTPPPGMAQGMTPGAAAGTAPGAVPAAPAMQAPAQLPGVAGQAGHGSHASMTDIIDIKPPVLPEYDLTWLYWLLGILAALALIALCVWLWKKKRARKAPPPLPPYMVATNALDAIQQASYAPREFYFQLSHVFRAYIENGLGLRALEKTTEELAPSLDKLPVDKVLIQEAKSFLKRSDPVKYAGLSADDTAMQKDLRFVRDVVETTRPQPEEQTKGAAKESKKANKTDMSGQPTEAQTDA